MKSEETIEIIVRWQGSLIRVDHFQGDHNIVINGSDPFVTVPLEWLGKETHLLMSTKDGDTTVFFLPLMHVKLNGLERKTFDYRLTLGDDLKIKIGPFNFDIRCSEGQRPVMSPFANMAAKTLLPA